MVGQNSASVDRQLVRFYEETLTFGTTPQGNERYAVVSSETLPEYYMICFMLSGNRYYLKL